jgi:hypothetical protein
MSYEAIAKGFRSCVVAARVDKGRAVRVFGQAEGKDCSSDKLSPISDFLQDIYCAGRVNGDLKRSGVEVTPRFGIDNFGLALSLATSEHGVPLLPISIEDDVLSIVSRRLKGKQPTLDLMIGYRRMATHRGS